MVDVEKRSFTKPWMMHDYTKTVKNRFYETHLPLLKQVREQGVTVKQPTTGYSKRQTPTNLLPIHRNNTTTLNNPLTLITRTEKTPSPVLSNSAVYEAAKRFILRNTTAKFSREPSSIYLSNSFNRRRATLYNHVQAKIDTGLSHTDSKEIIELQQTHQLEPTRSVDWSALKHDIEQDIYIRAYSNRIQFNSGITYGTQMATLANLVRSKIKVHLFSTTGSGDERYKIVVHLTIFETTTAGLHVVSRCLWNTETDNSITVKMQGVDCDILIIAFLCYTNVGTI